jgi:hypothetical protein
VTAINGLDLADASAGAIGVEIRRRRLALRVLRSGGPNPLRIEPVVPENVSRLSLR